MQYTTIINFSSPQQKAQMCVHNRNILKAAWSDDRREAKENPKLGDYVRHKILYLFLVTFKQATSQPLC